MLKILLTAVSLIFLSTIYDYSIPDINGNTIQLGAFTGKKILIVNIASSSKYINQVGSLEQLYQKYKDRVVIIAVPSNSFGNESRNDSELKKYLTKQFHYNFLLTATTYVSGNNQSPLFQWITRRDQNGMMDNIIRNDFYKFLIDDTGKLIGAYAPSVDPMNSEIQNAIQLN